MSKVAMKNQSYETFVNSITDSIKNFDYFVDWKKVDSLKKEYEIQLHLLNYLIGKENVKDEIRYLIERDPSIVQIFPILIATREQQMSLFEENSFGQKEHIQFSFIPSTIKTTKDIDAILFFLEKSGIIELIQKQKIRSFPDYVYGIEIGMDTNGRKNRGGKLMENLIESYIHPMKDITYLSQASYKKVQKAFGITLHKDLQRRIFDFVIQKNNTYTFVETNFFNDGGTKLKSVVGEFKGIQQLFDKHHPEYKLVWVTDGSGWKKSLYPLEDAFNHIPNILNINDLNEEKLKTLI